MAYSILTHFSPSLSFFSRRWLIRWFPSLFRPQQLGISTKYARQYIEPYWREYNEKLLLAVPQDRRRGPVVAERSDHFIQLDRPDLVADEIVRLVDLISTAEGK